ncbi:hypothetical protein HT031_003885 [Scenedesmus sp. PABB004]|nr:hypothetical protein HT031_003885 [Scenedesmus sp. PABB004]
MLARGRAAAALLASGRALWPGGTAAGAAAGCAPERALGGSGGSSGRRSRACSGRALPEDALPDGEEPYHWIPHPDGASPGSVGQRRAAGRLEHAVEAVLLGDGVLREALVAAHGLTIHRIRLAKDRRAVHVLWDAAPGQAPACAAALERNAFRLRAELARVLRSRHTPFLEFRHNHLPPLQAAVAAAMDAAEAELAAAEEQPRGGGGAAADVGLTPEQQQQVAPTAAQMAAAGAAGGGATQTPSRPGCQPLTVEMLRSDSATPLASPAHLPALRGAAPSPLGRAALSPPPSQHAGPRATLDGAAAAAANGAGDAAELLRALLLQQAPAAAPTAAAPSVQQLAQQLLAALAAPAPATEGGQVAAEAAALAVGTPPAPPTDGGGEAALRLLAAGAAWGSRDSSGGGLAPATPFASGGGGAALQAPPGALLAVQQHPAIAWQLTSGLEQQAAQLTAGGLVGPAVLVPALFAPLQPMHPATFAAAAHWQQQMQQQQMQQQMWQQMWQQMQQQPAGAHWTPAAWPAEAGGLRPQATAESVASDAASVAAGDAPRGAAAAWPPTGPRAAGGELAPWGVAWAARQGAGLAVRSATAVAQAHVWAAHTALLALLWALLGASAAATCAAAASWQAAALAAREARLFTSAAARVAFSDLRALPAQLAAGPLLLGAPGGPSGGGDAGSGDGGRLVRRGSWSWLAGAAASGGGKPATPGALLDSVSVVSGLWVGMGVKLALLLMLHAPGGAAGIWLRAAAQGLTACAVAARATAAQLAALAWVLARCSVATARAWRAAAPPLGGAADGSGLHAAARVALLLCGGAAAAWRFAAAPALVAGHALLASSAAAVPGGRLALQLLVAWAAAAGAVLGGAARAAHWLATADDAAWAAVSAQGLAAGAATWAAGAAGELGRQLVPAAERGVAAAAAWALAGAPPVAQAAAWGSASMLRRLVAEAAQQSWLLAAALVGAWRAQQAREQRR